jgi:HTH-type transcriptional regulator, competence development regulator
MDNRLGRHLKRVRERREWSLARTAKEAGVSTAYVQKIERGEVSSPSPHKLRALAGGLGIPFEEVMRLAGYAGPPSKGSSEEDSVRVLAQALQAEGLTAGELEDLSDYLQFRRRQQKRDA